MAELTAAETTAADPCCAPEQQASCCEPSAKADCCGHEEGCGCAAGSDPTHATDVREQVRERYAAAAVQVTTTDPGAGCCAPSETFDGGSEIFGAALYALDDREQLPDTAKLASLGCGNPTAVAELHEGETVLDLGSGGGIDVLLSARRVGPTGKAHGLDMTDEMLALARENARKAGVKNVEFHKGYIEEIPLPDASVDVVISNCVINLSHDKPRVLREVARVLRPGGRFAVSDVIADEGMDDATRADMQAYTGCIAGALTHHEFTQVLADAGLTNVDIRETHRVHPQAASAIVRAQKPISRQAGPVADLPMAPGCALDESGLRSQLERYRQIGRNARLIERTARGLVVDLDESVDAELVTEAIAVERKCCPFFRLGWEPNRRRLTVSVPQAAHEAALDAIASALDVQRSD